MKNQTAQDPQSLIEVKNLSFKRGERVIYDDVSLNIRRADYRHYGTFRNW